MASSFETPLSRLLRMRKRGTAKLTTKIHDSFLSNIEPNFLRVRHAADRVIEREAIGIFRRLTPQRLVQLGLFEQEFAAEREGAEMLRNQDDRIAWLSSEQNARDGSMRWRSKPRERQRL
ncbi:hypothetical protein [Bradyrhizobium sp.]|uniref:hypothetical protein n=1 Tax=Bradyrhizobium sp. TaxID=376 RepID=UPI002D72271E|nr:hypothetical protein [Bradyrhizobium sp.]HZR72611.1 hypothetical protein [Bradyrhizobium sp.]